MVTRKYLYQMFGSFWTQIWNEPALLEAATTAFREGFGQLENDRADIQSYLARNDIPLAFFRHFNYVAATEDQFTPVYTVLGSFDMDSGARLDSLQSAPPAWRLGNQPMQTVELLVDSPAHPTVIWQRGQEFDYADGVFTFYRNPFDNGFLADVQSTDGVILRQCKLWCCNVNFDVKGMTDYFGIYFGAETPSTYYYKRLANIIWDLALEGATIGNATAFLCALADTDVVQADGTVAAVWTEHGRNFVATAADIYSSPAAAIVAAGAAVTRGQNIFDAVHIQPGSLPVSAADFPLLHIGTELLSAKYEGGLLLENRDCVLTNSHFPVGGLPATVNQWWADVDADLAARGIDLWTIETQGQNYPYRVNPLNFIREYVLKTNSLFVWLDRTKVPDQARNMKFLDYLLRYMPAATTFFVYVSAGVDDEPMTSREMMDLDGAEAFLTMDVREANVFATAEQDGAGHKLW